MIRWNDNEWWFGWELRDAFLMIFEQVYYSIQCYCRIMKEGVMWVSLSQGMKQQKRDNEVDEWWRSDGWENQDFCYLRRGVEGGMWEDCCWVIEFE